MRRRQLLTLTAGTVVLMGGAALFVSLLTGGPSTWSDAVITPASAPASAPGKTSVALPPKEAAPAEVLDAYLQPALRRLPVRSRVGHKFIRQ